MRSLLSISSELDKLYYELDIVQSMSEESVRLTFNVDSKKEYIELINEGIDSLENELEESELCKDNGQSLLVLVKSTVSYIKCGTNKFYHYDKRI